jgi:hypothetical protein
MKKTLLIILLILGISIPSAIAVSNTIQGYIVDYNITYYGDLNKKLSYPLISYNDNTYMAVRDVANLWNKDINWSEDDKSILLYSKSHNNDYKKNVIKEEKTALAIGKAIIEEYYPDDVNENTIYYASYTYATGFEYDDCWNVYAQFNPDFSQFNPDEADDVINIIQNHDVHVSISVISGNFSIYDNNTYKTIVDFIIP